MKLKNDIVLFLEKIILLYGYFKTNVDMNFVFTTTTLILPLLLFITDITASKRDMKTQTDVTGEQELALQQEERIIRQQRILEKKAFKKQDEAKRFVKELEEAQISFEF